MVALGSEPLEISDAQFRALCDLVRDHCGLHFGDDSRFLVEKRIARRLATLGGETVASYLYRLRNLQPGDDELAQLVDDLTTNETYFFREQRQLRALVDEILPEMLERRRVRGGDSPVTIWSSSNLL